jgi:hypothetical protein
MGDAQVLRRLGLRHFGRRQCILAQDGSGMNGPALRVSQGLRQ